jgi:hypothetical protein
MMISTMRINIRKKYCKGYPMLQTSLSLSSMKSETQENYKMLCEAAQATFVQITDGITYIKITHIDVAMYRSLAPP